jgi:hypothetical protein
MAMDKRNNKGIACKIRLMTYLPINASAEHKLGTAYIGHSVPQFLSQWNSSAYREYKKPSGWSSLYENHPEVSSERNYELQVKTLLILATSRAGAVVTPPRPDVDG